MVEETLQGMNGLQFAALVIACAVLYRYAIHDKLTKENNMTKSLSDMMEFDHVIEVLEDGTVNESPGISIYAELNVDTQGEDDFQLEKGWELLQGFTGQYGYNGPVMHPSEYIGGGLERHILSTPGYYVALVVDTNCEHEECTAIDGCDCDPAGWVIAFKPKD